MGKMTEKFWCKHMEFICAADVDYQMNGILTFYGENWRFCPVCGAEKPNEERGERSEDGKMFTPEPKGCGIEKLPINGGDMDMWLKKKINEIIDYLDREKLRDVLRKIYS